MTATLAPATGLPAASMTVPLRVRSGFSAGRTCGAPIGPLAAGSGSPPAAVFFFQAEDGIRDLYVTGVQTCGLPISSIHTGADEMVPSDSVIRRQSSLLRCPVRNLCASICATDATRRCSSDSLDISRLNIATGRSEERRVGKECESGCARGEGQGRV